MLEEVGQICQTDLPDRQGFTDCVPAYQFTQLIKIATIRYFDKGMIFKLSGWMVVTGMSYIYQKKKFTPL